MGGVIYGVASPTQTVHELVQEALGEEEESYRFVFRIDSSRFITGASLWSVGKVVAEKMCDSLREGGVIIFVVLGATGNTGSVVADTLLSRKQPVRIVVRSADKGAAWKAKGAEIAVASLDEVSSLSAVVSSRSVVPMKRQNCLRKCAHHFPHGRLGTNITHR